MAMVVVPIPQCIFRIQLVRKIVISDMQNDCHYWTFLLSVRLCRDSIGGLGKSDSLQQLLQMRPPEAYHRHCSFPISMQGVRRLALQSVYATVLTGAQR